MLRIVDLWLRRFFANQIGFGKSVGDLFNGNLAASENRASAAFPIGLTTKVANHIEIQSVASAGWPAVALRTTLRIAAPRQIGATVAGVIAS